MVTILSLLCYLFSLFFFCSSPLFFLPLRINISSSTRNVVTSSLEGFRNSSTFSPPARYSAAVLSSAAATVSAVLATNPARATFTGLSSPDKYHSLLDALCISPVSKPLAFSYLQSSRKSSGSIHVKKIRYCGADTTVGVCYKRYCFL